MSGMNPLTIFRENWAGFGWLFGKKRINELARTLILIDHENSHLRRKLEMSGEQIQELAKARDGFITQLRGRKAKLKELGVDVKELDAKTVADKGVRKSSRVVPIFDTANGAIHFDHNESEDAAEDAAEYVAHAQNNRSQGD